MIILLSIITIAFYSSLLFSLFLSTFSLSLSCHLDCLMCMCGWQWAFTLRCQSEVIGDMTDRLTDAQRSALFWHTEQPHHRKPFRKHFVCLSLHLTYTIFLKISGHPDTLPICACWALIESRSTKTIPLDVIKYELSFISNCGARLIEIMF